jgi:hypothetical protein
MQMQSVTTDRSQHKDMTSCAWASGNRSKAAHMWHLSCAGPAEWVDRYGSEPRKGADILVQALEREGVGRVFAYPGGASMEIHQALTRSPTVRNILCRHEQVRPLPSACLSYTRLTVRSIAVGRYN